MITPRVTIKKKTKPNIITRKETKALLELLMVNPKIIFKKTLDSWPWASDKAQSLK